MTLYTKLSRSKLFFYLILTITIVIVSVAIVVRFSSPHSSQPVAIVLSPHYDDAVLSVGGLLSRGSTERIVATFFAGVPTPGKLTWWDKTSGFRSSREAAQKRAVENKNALALLGIDRDHIKDYFYRDAQYRFRGGKFLKENQAITGYIITEIRALISRYPHRPVRVYAPILDYVPGGWGHVDHEIVHDALLAVARTTRDPDITFYFYEDFIDYLHQFQKNNPQPLKSYIEAKSGIALEREVIPLSPADFAVKMKSVEQYSSQLVGFEKEGIFLERLRAELKEHFPDSCGSLGLTSYSCEVVYKLTATPKKP